MNRRTMTVLTIAGLIIALAMTTGTLSPRSQSEATPLAVEEQNQVTEEQSPSQDKATATITITWTTIPHDNENNL